MVLASVLARKSREPGVVGCPSSDCWLPTHVRRPGDVIPTIPPRRIGYADHPYEFMTNGQPYLDSKARRSLIPDSWRWAKFLAKRFRPHMIETYRGELGMAADAAGAHSPLTLLRWSSGLVRVSTRRSEIARL